MSKSFNGATPKVVSALIIIAIISSGVYAFIFKGAKTADGTAANETASSGETTDSAGSQSIAASTVYKDGTYTASAGYAVPRGKNTITVTASIAGDAITFVKSAHQYAAGDNQSVLYTQDFDAAITGQVVGKKIENISLSRVGGASLTTGGFNSALSSIASQAKM